MRANQTAERAARRATKRAREAAEVAAETAERRTAAADRKARRDAKKVRTEVCNDDPVRMKICFEKLARHPESMPSMCGAADVAHESVASRMSREGQTISSGSPRDRVPLSVRERVEGLRALPEEEDRGVMRSAQAR